MEKFSFFNSVNGDRRYKAEDWANYFNKFITNGYFPNIASNLQVIASGTNMKVTLRAGAAWINGYMYQNTTDFDLTIQTADAVNSRKDRVVLRLDHEKRDIRAYVKKGTPSSSPVAPALQRDADAYELSVAEVYVRNGAVVITQEAVTDVRLNKDLCGVVNSLIQADTTMIFNQYWDWFVRTKQKYEEDNSVLISDFRKFMEDEKKRYNAEFTAWFQTLKNVLDSNTAGNLLNEINKINDKWNATLIELDKKSQVLQHGLNVVNAPVASPLNIEIQGRTLVNLLGQTSLDPSKYYLYIPGKGTTKITAGSNTYEGIAKFTGQSTVSYTIKQDFRGKIARSIVENGHSAKTTGSKTTLVNPTDTLAEAEGEYPRLYSLNGAPYFNMSSSISGGIAQQLFSFDIIRTLEDKFGSQIWQGKTALVDKVAIAKLVITKITCNWWGYGSGPIGNKANLSYWNNISGAWGTSLSHNASTVDKIIQTSTNMSAYIDSNGFVHFLVYAEPSNGSVSSVINTDYIELGLEVNLSLPLLEDALYEIDQTTYNKISVDPEYSGQKLLDKFPYVQGVQHLNPLVTIEGGNLIPPYTDGTWGLHENAKVLSSYELELNPTGQYNSSSISIPVVIGQTYTLTVPKTSYEVLLYRGIVGGAGNVISLIKSGMSHTFTVTDSYQGFINIRCGNEGVASGKFNFSNLMLVLGDKPKPFAPRNPSYLYTNTVLAGQNGVNDVLYQEEGQWKVLRKWERDVVIEGETINTENVVESVNKSGYKEMVVKKAVPQKPATLGHIMIKPNGAISTKVKADVNTGIDSFYLEPINSNLYLRISNEESGFLQTYWPQVAEIQAYFNGWKVKTADGTGKPIAWKSVVDDKDAPTQTLAYVRANKAPNYTPYKLTYQLATPRVETVQVEGELAVSGVTQVSVDSGIVVREKVNPILSPQGTVYEINKTGAPLSHLKNKTTRIISVYKNGVVDKKWDIQNMGSSYWNGGGGAQLKPFDFDPTAEYTVTYLVQDKHLFTTNVIDAKVMYNQSLASTVREVVEKQADTSTLLFAVQDTVSQLTVKTREYGLRLTPRRSGRDENDVFTITEYKMANGTVRIRSVLSNPNAYGSYLTRTETEYFENGAIQRVTYFDLIYDVDGNFIDEVERT